METPAVAYLGQRLEALAIIHLTRRKDLVVTKPKLGLGVELFVYITRPDEPTRRVFGVTVKGTTDAVADERRATKLMNSMKIEPQAQLMMPVCVFLFSMRDDQGYYDWRSEPRLENGKVRLPLKTEFAAKKLDPAALDGVIDEVNRWYDAALKLPVMSP